MEHTPGEAAVTEGERGGQSPGNRGCGEVIFRNVIDILPVLYAVSVIVTLFWFAEANEITRRGGCLSSLSVCFGSIGPPTPPPYHCSLALASQGATRDRPGLLHPIPSFYGMGSVSLLLTHMHTESHSERCTSAAVRCSRQAALNSVRYIYSRMSARASECTHR